MRKDFCLCFNDAYVPYAAVTIRSIRDNVIPTDELHIHVLSDYLTESNRTRLENYGADVHIVEDKEVLQGIDTREWPIYTLYRLFLPEIIDAEVHRVLYLDCDVIVNGNLDALFALDLSGKAVAGCIDPNAYSDEVFQRLEYDKEKSYICAGVLLMNLDFWRATGLSRRVIDYMRCNPEKIAYLEQDALNVLCQDCKIVLPSCYGVLVPFFFFEPFMKEHIDEIEELMDAPVIIHFAGYFPWIFCKDKALHSTLWWNICKRLEFYPQVRKRYVGSMLKWWVRYALSTLHLIVPESRYHVNQYYNHPRVKREAVEKQIRMLRNNESVK